MDSILGIWTSLVDSIRTADLALLVLRLTLIGAFAHLVLALLRRAPASARHVVAIGAIACMLATPGLVALGGFAPALRVPLPVEPPALMRTLDRSAETGWTTASRASSDRGITGNARPSRNSFPAWKSATTRETPESPVRAWTPSSGASLETMPATLATSAPVDRAARAWSARRNALWDRAASMPWSWPALAVFALVLGAWTLGSLRVLAIACGAWMAREATPVEQPRLLAALERARRQIGLDQPVEMRLTDRVTVPAVAGMFQPVLLLPHEAIEWSDSRLRLVILHELAHVQRCDALSFGLARFATAILWFHPLVWTLARAAREDCERACDDAVLRAGVLPSDYADQLLAIARGSSTTERWPSMSLAFARPSHLEGRLLAILRPDVSRRPMTRRSSTAVVLGLMLLLIPIAAVRVVAATAPDDDAKNTKYASETSTRWEMGTRTRTATRTTTSYAGTTAPMPPPAEWEMTSTQDGGGREFPNLGPVESHTGGEWFAFAKQEYDARRFATAGEAYERAARAGYRPAVSWYNAGCSFSLDGQQNRALGAVHEAMQNGFDDAKHIGKDDDLVGMHSDRRFRMLIDAALLEKEAKKEEKDQLKEKTGSRDAERARDDADRVERDRRRQELDAARRAEARDKARALRQKQKVEAEYARRESMRRTDLNSKDPRVLRSAGIYLLRNGEPERAVEFFEAQFALDSTASSLYNTACAYSVAGQKARALDKLEAAVYAGYGDVEKFTSDDDLRGIHREDRFDRILDLVDDLDLERPHGIWRDDENVEGWQRLLPRYEKATQDHPKAGRAWFNLGFATLRSERYPDSRAAFLKALDLGYRIRSTHYNLACVASQQGDLEEAMRRLKLARSAGMRVGEAAIGDRDLIRLRRDSRYREQLLQWHDAEKALERDEDRRRDRDKRKSKDDEDFSYLP